MKALARWRVEHIALLGLLLLAAWFRLWRLNSTPPGLWFDEGFNGMEVAWMLKKHVWPVFILGGQGREVIFFYLLAAAVAVLGETIYALRLVPALIGVVTVALMYRWLRLVFDSKVASRWVALWGAAGLAVSFWFLVMNRDSYRANTLLPVLLVTACLFWQGWQTGPILTVFFLLLITSYNVILPLGRGYDRVAHLSYIRFIAKNRRLPASYEEREAAGYKTRSDHLPFYHGLAGFILLISFAGELLP